MIKSITVTNHLGESICLELMRPEKSGFIIQSIDGLGPAKANVNFTELATIDGSIDNSAKLEERNIILSLIFLERGTIEDTRLLSYKYFPVKRNITFQIETDNRICETVGRVESNDPSIFDQQEGCQISILCPDPYFYSIENHYETFYGVDPLFEFPFSNESLTEKLIEFGSINIRTYGTVIYTGDEEVGLTIRIHSIGSVKGLTIYNIEKREIFKIDDEKLEKILGSGIIAGDEITITTVKGYKSITILRDGEYINIINSLEKPIVWFQLEKGENTFAYTAEEGLENLNFRIENRILYEGV